MTLSCSIETMEPNGRKYHVHSNKCHTVIKKNNATGQKRFTGTCFINLFLSAPFQKKGLVIMNQEHNSMPCDVMS